MSPAKRGIAWEWDLLASLGKTSVLTCEEIQLLPTIVRLDDGTMRMYYTGQGEGGSTAIGVAKVMAGESAVSWVREQAEFSFA